MLLYRIFIWLYPKAIWLVSFANPKARLWLQGRKDIFERLADSFQHNTRPVIWMHCSSLGEFEQGLPVLEGLRKQYPSHLVMLTFFSPSGYEIRKNHPVADYIFYLPMDSPINAKRFVQIVNPTLTLFVKYEFWYFFLKEINTQKIPLLLVSGVFRNSQPFFKWYGGFYRKMIGFFSWLFVQNQESVSLLQNIGMSDKTILAGDTRFDRVLQAVQHKEPLADIEAFCGSNQVIVAGSTWTEDDEELDHFANTNPDIKFIIAPHNIDNDRLKECQALYKHSILYSAYKKEYAEGNPLPTGINVLIIDNMGMLITLYRYASICYVGGGFGDDGIHNVLEAAVYYKPVVFGPVYDKYFEAEELLDAGGGFSIENALELESVLKELLTNRTMLETASKAAGDYVQSKAGATANILSYIQANRLLIS